MTENKAIYTKLETEVAPHVKGLVIFVTDQYGNALIFQNNETKRSTQKIRGQLTAPAETINPGESLNEVLPRTIYEEIGRVSRIEPIKRGIICVDAPERKIVAIGMELKVKREEVQIDPHDADELSLPRWVSLIDIDNRTMRIGKWDVPVYRSFLPELASNVLKGRSGKRYPFYKHLKSTLPKELFEYLEQNPGPVHPVK